MVCLQPIHTVSPFYLSLGIAFVFFFCARFIAIKCVTQSGPSCLTRKRNALTFVWPGRFLLAFSFLSFSPAVVFVFFLFCFFVCHLTRHTITQSTPVTFKQEEKWTDFRLAGRPELTFATLCKSRHFCLAPIVGWSPVFRQRCQTIRPILAHLRNFSPDSCCKKGKKQTNLSICTSLKDNFKTYFLMSGSLSRVKVFWMF